MTDLLVERFRLLFLTLAIFLAVPVVYIYVNMLTTFVLIYFYYI